MVADISRKRRGQISPTKGFCSQRELQGCRRRRWLVTEDGAAARRRGRATTQTTPGQGGEGRGF